MNQTMSFRFLWPPFAAFSSFSLCVLSIRDPNDDDDEYENEREF
jgi:hypothetical protein